MKIITKNKRAYFDYDIKETIDAGIVLKWYEVKSIKQWRVNITDAIVKIRDGEAWITNMDIPLYEKTNPALVPWYKPKGERKLLLTKKQIQRLYERTHKTWLILKPLEVFVTKNWKIKIKLWLAKLKKKIEKRQIIKERDMKRQMAKELKSLRI